MAFDAKYVKPNKTHLSRRAAFGFNPDKVAACDQTCLESKQEISRFAAFDFKRFGSKWSCA